MRLPASAALLGILALAGCSAPRQATVAATHTGAGATDGLVILDPNEKAERTAYGDSIRGLLDRREFDALERIADDLRRNDVRFPNGAHRLGVFYGEGCGETGADDDAVRWARQIERARSWREQRPGSITAAVAYAHALVGWAWAARGGGYASTVTVDGGKLFVERLAEAHRVLDQAAELPGRCPGFYMVAHQIALGEAWPVGECERLFQEAVSFDPHYEGFYSARSWHLMPRWYGKEGDWERFLDEATLRLSATEADEVYAREVARNAQFYDNVFEQSEASWHRTRNGLLSLVARHPDSFELKSRLAKLALDAGEPETARAMFDALANRVDLFVWKSTENFVRARDLARRAGPA